MRNRHTLALLVIIVGISSGVNSTRAQDNYFLAGKVDFSNLQNLLASGEPAPYIGRGFSTLGFSIQTGSIQPTSFPALDENGNLFIDAQQGPNPNFFGLPVHVLKTRKGMIFFEWKARLTILADFPGAPTGRLTGDGDFNILFGTGTYRGATGRLRTLFLTPEIPLNQDTASAAVLQYGSIDFD